MGDDDIIEPVPYLCPTCDCQDFNLYTDGSVFCSQCEGPIALKTVEDPEQTIQ